MENRNHKDSLFIDLFCKDKEGKQNFISLYNALHNTNLDLATTIVQEVNIENVLYMALSNDIAMLVDNKLVILEEYSLLIDYIRESKKQNPKAPLEQAINKALQNGVLSEYLKRKSTEIKNMLIAEYSYETDIKVQRREAYREGLEQGAEQKAIETAEKLLKEGLPVEQIARCTDLPLKKVQELTKEIEVIEK